MRAVLDTGIFVRALINPHSTCGKIVFEYSGDYLIVVSPDVIREILEVIRRPELHRRFPEMAQLPPMALVLSILEVAEVVEPRERLGICRDPTDDKFFECAVFGEADYIVSEDKDILAVGQYQGVRTVSAAAFIAILEAEPRG